MVCQRILITFFYSYVFIFENGPTVWSATLRVVGAGKSDLMVGTPYARQPKCQVKQFYLVDNMNFLQLLQVLYSMEKRREALHKETWRRLQQNGK